jgi:hypothetical protein
LIIKGLTRSHFGDRVVDAFLERLLRVIVSSRDLDTQRCRRPSADLSGSLGSISSCSSVE